MKLNNKGFSFKGMLIMGSIIFGALLIAGYYINQLYNEFSINSISDYQKMEYSLKEAGKEYSKNNSYSDGIISYETLKEYNYIDTIKDALGNECNGYVIVENLSFYSYIKCPNYKSANYIEKYE